MARARVSARRGAAARKPRADSYPGSIRIIGGRWRSRRLPVLTSEGLRPTPDRVRETLFNWLAPYIAGARCVDLFAGSGALCLEALSRGASEVVMVERSYEVARQLQENIGRLQAEGAMVARLDALEYLAGRPTAFDIVFLDPPFAVAADMIEACARRLAQGWVRNGSLVYIEAPRALKALSLPAGWEPSKSGMAGQVRYCLVPIRAGG